MATTAAANEADFVCINLSAFDDLILFQKFKLRVRQRNPVAHFHHDIFSLIDNFLHYLASR
ncbi:hypothetical protein D3C76_1643420 [compost metagenome]